MIGFFYGWRLAGVGYSAGARSVFIMGALARYFLIGDGMGLFDGIVGGVIGAGLTKIVGEMIQKQGGVAGIMSQFEQHGMGDVVKSWVGTGANLPVSGAQLQQVLGSDTLKQVADKLGIPVDTITAELTKHLPQAVDQMTPDGVVPASQAA